MDKDLQEPLDLPYLDYLMKMVKMEVIKASNKFTPYHSSHEGYAVILEEVDELWDDVKANNTQHAHIEAKQVAATAVRFLYDLYDKDFLESYQRASLSTDTK